MEKIRVGISACLLGDKVRYDGGHKLDRYIVNTLGQFFEYVPVCPEHELGLGVPREAMRLVGDPDAPRLVTRKTGIDHTDAMVAWSAQRTGELAGEGLRGFIFKAKSPSSGMERVKVYGTGGMPANTGVGLFARAFMERFPHLPVEEDGRLHDPVLRENFVERIFVNHRWLQLVEAGLSRGGLVDFHTRHKMLIRAHSLTHYRGLGKLVAEVKERGLEETAHAYLSMLMEALKLRATRRKNADVLLHCLGHFRKFLTGDEKAELLESVARYKAEYVPLIVPVTLINHYVRKYQEPYLALQVYLNPHPIELALRSSV
jgi:uncharacterized protein YbgA (DUF1722 family)/uncharacterized protein YbbK (DUF523 family)